VPGFHFFVSTCIITVSNVPSPVHHVISMSLIRISLTIAVYHHNGLKYVKRGLRSGISTRDELQCRWQATKIPAIVTIGLVTCIQSGYNTVTMAWRIYGGTESQWTENGLENVGDEGTPEIDDKNIKFGAR